MHVVVMRTYGHWSITEDTGTSTKINIAQPKDMWDLKYRKNHPMAPNISL